MPNSGPAERLAVSVILPVRDERDNLDPLLGEIAEAFRDVPHEVIAVDDGSTDGSWDVLAGAARPGLRAVRLDRASGQSAAIAAGFAEARAPIVITLDADGQNDPADARKLLAALEGFRGYAAVVGYRVERQDGAWRRLQSRIANRVRDWITRDHVRDSACGLKAIRREALHDVPRFDGMHRFLPTLLRQAGARVLEVPVRDRPRRAGHSKYGMWRRAWRGWRDAWGVRWLGRRALHGTIAERSG